MSGFPIHTPRLLIRSFTPDDAEAMFKVLGDAETMRFFAIWRAKSVENVRGFIRWVTGMERDFGYSFWAVVEKESGEVIGDCGLAPLEGEGPEVELGCDLRRDRWNRGYATEAAAACLEYGFTELKLERLIPRTSPPAAWSRNWEWSSRGPASTTETSRSSTRSPGPRHLSPHRLWRLVEPLLRCHCGS
jgi:RimJ/RimL family protein N-acetyltransferase